MRRQKFEEKKPTTKWNYSILGHRCESETKCQQLPSKYAVCIYNLVIIRLTRTSETLKLNPRAPFSNLSALSAIGLCPNGSGVIVPADKQTDKQTDTTENNTTLAARVVNIRT